MCGILGSVPRSEQTTFKTALDRIAHRGPDAEGIIHLSEISLGHRRLSILDLTESGSQPMFSSDQRYIIAYNGEIYNYLEIRAVLEKDGFSFKTESDTEIVLAAYIKWGPACLSKFNGMWAISIWDKQTKELFVSRDRFGKKPFFYIHDQERFIFASEMKSLLPFLSEIKPHPDFERMKEAPFSYESTERCLIQGIKRFPAGSFAFLRSNKLCIKRFWNTLDHLQAPSSNYEKQVEEFQELFIDSCKLRLRSDVPIGTALSGGLDSSATIGVATNLARTNNKPTPKAFVASFPQSTIDETPYAQRVIDHLKIDSKIIPINPILEWKKILEYIYLTEELYLTSPIPMIMTYREIKKDGVSVTLDGHGADELFSGYGHIREAYVDAPYSSKNFSEIYEALHGYPGSSLEIWKESLQVKSKDMAKHLLQRGISSKDSNHENFKKLDHFSKHLYVIFHETILPTLIRNYDRYSMASGVEIRMPFMDHRIVSYVFSIGYESKFRKGYTKSLIRDAVAPYLPQEIAYRKTKIGFNSPFHEWIKGPLKEYFLDTIESEAFRNSNLLSDSKSLAKDINTFIMQSDKRYEVGEKLWQNFQPFLWEQIFLKT